MKLQNQYNFCQGGGRGLQAVSRISARELDLRLNFSTPQRRTFESSNLSSWNTKDRVKYSQITPPRLFPFDCFPWHNQ